jgi:hypothetical protein
VREVAEHLAGILLNIRDLQNHRGGKRWSPKCIR